MSHLETDKFVGQLFESVEGQSLTVHDRKCKEMKGIDFEDENQN
jgi:hypothetical protein